MNSHSPVPDTRCRMIDSKTSPLAGKIGKPMRINKKALFIDTAYQRMPSPGRALAIASNLDLTVFGWLTVSSRPSGYFVIDGGHRLAAALRRDDMQNLPCIVYDGLTVKDEAWVYEHQNNERRKVSGADLYRSLLVQKDQAALSVQTLLANHEEAIGREHCVCPLVLIKLAEKDTKKLYLVADIIRETWPQSTSGERWNMNVLIGVWGFLDELESVNTSVVEIAKKLGRKTLKLLLTDARSAHAVRAYTTIAKAFCARLVEEWNYGRRTKKLAK